MSKVKVKLKLTGFELEIEASREDIPLIAAGVQQQLGGLLAPTSTIIDIDPPRAVNQPALPPAPPKKVRSGKRASAPAANGASDSDAVVFTHNPNTWGTPVQGWSAAEKSVWLLYVVGQQTDHKELTGPRIAKTFALHFRQSGPIRSQNVARDLGKLKAQQPSLVSQDAIKPGEPWFLTDAGIAHAQKLVSQARGEAA